MCMYILHLTEVQYVQRRRQKQSACQAGPCAPQKRNVRQGARHAPVHTQGTINRHCQGKTAVKISAEEQIENMTQQMKTLLPPSNPPQCLYS